MKVNGLDIERLRREGLPLKTAMIQLTDWVKSQTQPGTEPSFVGHNAPFDWSFVNYAYIANDLENPFGYKALDTKALAMGVLGVHWLDASKEVLEKDITLPKQKVGNYYFTSSREFEQITKNARPLEGFPIKIEDLIHAELIY